MSRRALIFIILLSLSVGAGFIAPTVAGNISATETSTNETTVQISESLTTQTGEQTVIVRLTERSDNTVQSTAQESQVDSMKTHAEQTQAAFERFAADNPHVEVDREFWITNALVVTVDTDAVSLERLGMVDNVDQIHENVDIEAADTAKPVPNALGTQELSTTASDDYTYGLETINTPETWRDFGSRGNGTTVAVLDTGVDASHPDLEVAQWKDFDDNPSSEPKDYGSHGTHVSGTVAGRNESGTHIGVAPETELMHGAVLTDCDSGGCSGSFSHVIDGIQWAVDNDADVVSMSLGANTYYSPLVDPVRNARQAGTIPVAASGNDGSGTSGSPANVYDSIAVGATNNLSGDEYVPWFSSGETVDTANDWGSAAPSDWPAQYVVPDVSAPGYETNSTLPGGNYGTKSGTSMATPHVSGAIAVVLSNGNGDPTADEIQTLLESTAVDIGEADTRQGEGRIDVYNATITHSRQTMNPTFTGTRTNVSESTQINVTVNHPVETYYWNFENGTTETTTEPTIERTFETSQNETVSLTLQDTQGENVTTTTDIAVVDNQRPTVQLTANRSSDVEVGVDTVAFDASQSTDNDEIVRYEWAFGDNTTTVTETPTINHRYETTGDLSASVTVVDAAENTNTTTQSIEVVDTTPPVPNITAPTATVVNSTVVLAANESTDNDKIEQFEWTFGDGLTKQTSNGTISHEFTTTGIETIELNVTDRAGYSSSTSTEITVQEPPAVSVIAPKNESYIVNDTVPVEYTLSNTSLDAAADLEYQVANESTGTVVTDWTPGAFEATNETVTRSLATKSLADGNYSVDLRIVDHEGTPLAYETATDSVSVAVKTTPPTVGLNVRSETTGVDEFGPNNPAVLNVTVAGALDGEIQLSVTDTDGTPIETWNLTTDTGNGGVATVRWNATDGTGRLVNSGSYELGVTATDGLGHSNETTEMISVDTTPPVPDITAPEAAVMGSTVTLEATGSTDNSEIDQFEWTFADGSSEKTANSTLSHEFATAGTQTIKLTATDRAGNSNSTTTEIRVQQSPSVAVSTPENGSYLATEPVSVEYTLSNTTIEGAAALDYRVVNESTETVVTNWTAADFEATNETVTRSLTTTSLADGNYSVDLRIVDQNGTPLAYESATDTVSFAVKTTPPSVDLDVRSETPEFDQVGPNNPAVLNVTVSDALDGAINLDITDTDGTPIVDRNLTTDTGSGGVATVRWDGTTETGTLVDSGSYAIGVTADDGLGNTNETTETVSVDTTPPAPTIAAPDRVVVDSAVRLDASESTDDGEISQYDWTFPDGSTENTSDPVVSHEFATTGTETIRLTAIDQAGNTNSTSTEIAVQGTPAVSVTTPENESYVPNHTVPVEYALSNTSIETAAALEYRVVNESTDTILTDWTTGEFESTNEETMRSIATESVADGNYSVELRIVDQNGTPLAYESATDSVSFGVKTTPPTVGLDVSPQTTDVDLVGPNNPAALNVTVDDYLSTDTQLWITDTDGKAVVEWNLTTETGNGEQKTVSWDGTDSSGTPVDSGSYEVGVTATDNIGNKNETTETISVDTTPPVVSLSAPETEYTNTPFTLDAGGSTDNTEIERFEWTFPDGSTQTGKSLTHEFADGGTKTITVTVTDRAGNTNSTSTEITVEEIPAVSVTSPENESYVANHTVPIEYTLSHTDAEDTAALEYRLVSESTEIPITDWTESEYTETSGTVTRSVAVGALADGEYSVDLRLVDQNGDELASESTTDSVLFTIDTSPPTVALDVSSQTTGFDQFSPNNPATLNVTVDTPFGGDTQLSIVDANEATVAEWNLSTDTGSGQRATVSWDGTNETGTPLDSGSYEARVTATDSNGLTTERTESLTVDTTPPIPKITTADTVVMGSELTLDADNSTDNSEIEQFDWTFPDGSTTTGRSATHTFPSAGNETVTLTTTDQAGNTNSTSTEISVQPAPSVAVTAPENGSYSTTETVPIEYELSHTDIEETAALEYRLVDSATNQTVTDWTQGAYEKTDETVTQSTSVGPVADGNYSVDLRLVDHEGTPLNYTASADNVSLAVKTTPPSVDLDVRSETTEYDHVGPNNPAVLNLTVTDSLETDTQLSITDTAGTAVTEWNLTEATGSGELTTVIWNGTDESGTPVDSGSYAVGVTATDTLGNTKNVTETTETLTVDTDTPSVQIQSVEGANRHDRALFVNDSSTVTIEVDADDGRETPAPVENLTLQAESTETDDQFTPTIQRDADTETRWTATIRATELPEPGPYQFTARGVDAANNTGGAETTIEYDHTAPRLSAVIPTVDTDTQRAEVRVRSTESLAESPSVTATSPDGNKQSVALTETADRWTGSFEIDTSGQYTLTARGVDPAGNQGIDEATTTVDNSVSTANRTTTVTSDSGLFIRFNTTQEVSDRTVSMTETAISPEALDREQFGVQFLEGELDDVLDARLENATIGIPAHSEALPDGVELDDPQVEISYYNDGWESQPTAVRTVKNKNAGIDGTYWTTTVDSFSTYGVTVTDSEPPVLTNVTATPSDDSESVTIEANYEDELSAVNASAVELSINGSEKTTHESTSITSTSATHEGYPSGNGTYGVTLSVADTAGNTETYERVVEIETSDDEEGSGGGGVGGGGVGVGGDNGSVDNGDSGDSSTIESSSLSVSSSRLQLGELLTISLDVANSGTETAEETIVVRTGDRQLVSKQVSIPPETTREVALTYEFAVPGEYELAVDSESLGSLPAGTVTVADDNDTESEQPADSTSESVPGFGLLGAALAVCSLAILLGRRE